MSDHDDSFLSPAESLFADFLAQVERGEPADFEALCLAHTPEAVELRQLKVGHDALYQRLLEARPAVADVPHVSLMQRLQQEFGSDLDPGESIQEGAPGDSAFPGEVVAQLALRSGSFGRYTVHDEIAHGGMGAVLRVWDEDLRRWLAMKLVRARRAHAGPAPAGAVGSRTLGRFLEEAQVTGQLDHPGIVPVHELGLDAEGRVYFTMKLVEGRTLQAVFEELAKGEGGSTQSRVLGLIIKVCEAMSYAHSKGVIHRDLKPANIMVGKFGEVYVMDWGLARVLGRGDKKDIRLRSPDPEGAGTAGPSIESPLLTRDGDVVGTPAYMPPEQARGEVEGLDERADVYALGAMLYQLLSGQVPYVRPGEEPRWRVLLARVLEGPPQPLGQLAPRAPPELVAICERAMARDPHDRYANVSALGEDLSAFVEGRVVLAYETGAWAEARKWVLRNRSLAGSLAAAVVLLVAGLVSSLVLKAQSDTFAERADDKTEEAQKNEQEAKTQQLRAEAETEKVLRLSDVKVLQQLEEESHDLWPAYPDRIVELESWLERANALADNLLGHRETLAQMRARAHSWSPGERAGEPTIHARGGNTAGSESEVLALDGQVESSQTWRLDSTEEQWHHDVLAELIGDLDGFNAGLLADDVITTDHGWSVPKRLSFAQELEAGFGNGGEYAEAWAGALPAIRRTYPGLDLKPQMGLLPIGPDPQSGLWEFAHLMTGDPARRGSGEELVLTEATGVVLVLLRGGSSWMGAQSEDPDGRNHDPHAQRDEAPVHEVELSPFFLSKYEMTQGQWLRLTGRNPSTYQQEEVAPTLLHPVEQVSWDDCISWLHRAGLTLPSEAQWEYGARGGTNTPWWTGAERESLREKRAANLADQSAKRLGAIWPEIDDWPELDDGYAVHASAGTHTPNAFGLHDVAGNLWELCLDGWDGGYYSRSPKVDPVARWEGAAAHVLRGGGFSGAAVHARVADRDNETPVDANDYLGVRPARGIGP